MLVRCAPYRPRHRLVPLDYQASAVRRTAGKCLPLPPLAKMCICVISDLTAHGDMGGRSIVDTGGSSAVAGYWTLDSSRRSPPRWYCTVRNHLARWPLVALQINCRRPAAIGPPPPPSSPPFTAFPPALPSARPPSLSPFLLPWPRCRESSMPCRRFIKKVSVRYLSRYLLKYLISCT